MPCQLQNHGSRATVASTCITTMKLVVPPFSRRCRRGNGSLGAMTAARMRSSRWLPVSAVLVVTKKNLHDPNRLLSEWTQKERKQTVGNVNVKERSRYFAVFRWQ